MVKLKMLHECQRALALAKFKCAKIEIANWRLASVKRPPDLVGQGKVDGVSSKLVEQSHLTALSA